MPLTREEYYDTITRDYQRVASENARREWFYSTEPDEEQPKNSRILSTTKATAIIVMMVGRLTLDVMRCANLQWRTNTPLPNRESKRQPLDWDENELDRAGDF